MFKKYTDKTPEYSIWQYDGEEIIPHQVFTKLREWGYAFKIVTNQYESNGMTAMVHRHLELFKGIGDSNEASFRVDEGFYVVFIDYHPNPFMSRTISVAYDLDRFSPLV